MEEAMLLMRFAFPAVVEQVCEYRHGKIGV